MRLSNNGTLAYQDESLALVREGHLFISNRCERRGTDAYATRLGLRPVLCVRGEGAARRFYSDERLERAGAAPTPVLDTLFGHGGVQGLDGEQHRVRKALFMSLMTPQRRAELVELTARCWYAGLERSSARSRIVLEDAASAALAEAVCIWAGVPLAGDELRHRTSQLRAMVDGAVSLGPRHLQARRARHSAERWLAAIVEQVRAGIRPMPEEAATSVIARYRTENGEPLSPRIAAVEILNVLRPTVAVARFVVFAALALHRYPDWRDRLRDGGDARDAERFVTEVRRFYPFFPFVVAKARTELEWDGIRCSPGSRVLLDVTGTNHDARLWHEPDTFAPDRFRAGAHSPYALIPQGGGDHYAGHRCAGEWVTEDLMRWFARELASMRYAVPTQDLTVDPRRMLATPRSGFVLTDVTPPAHVVSG